MGPPKTNQKIDARDRCQTPRYGLEPLIPYLNPNWVVWEPACGEGLLSKALSEQVTEVISTDILSGIDFLHTPFASEVITAIVTNPPFTRKKEFMTRCYTLKRPFALLMPTETVSLLWFQELVSAHTPEPGIIWFNPRIQFKMPKMDWYGRGSQFATAWFTWKFGFTGNQWVRMEHWSSAYRRQFYE